MFVRHLSGGELTEYADGEMAGDRRRRAHEHLSRCDRCSRALDAIWEVVGEVRDSREVEAPYDLRLRIISQVSAEAVKPISCRVAGELIQQDLDGALSPLSAGLLRLHLDDCPACAEQQRTLSAATRLVRSLPPVSAPAGIWEKVAASRRTRPAPSWGVRLRPALAAVAMAAGAVFLGLHSLPRPASHVVASHDSRPSALRTEAALPAPAAPKTVVTEPVTPEPTVVASADEDVPAPPAATAVAPRPRSSAVTRRLAVRPMEQPPVARVVASTPARLESAPAVEPAVAQPRKSQGLRALAMMAKAVSSESEGRVSLARQSEPWQVYQDEAASEAPLTAATPAGAPGADSPGAPSGQSNTGAQGVRPGLAEVMSHAA